MITPVSAAAERALRARLVGLTLLSAVALPLALPNEIFKYGNAVIGIVCLYPVLIAISMAPSNKLAAVLGVLFGAVSTALADFWLMFFQGYTIWTYGGVILGYAGYNALLFPMLRFFAASFPRYRPFVLAAGWAFYEYLKSVGYLAFPWGLVGYPVENILPLIQFVDITGVWGLSLLMATVNAVLAEGCLLAYAAAPPWRLALPWRAVARGRIVFHPYVRQVAFVLFVFVVVLSYGVYKMAAPIPSKGTAHLLLVQQNSNPWSIEGAVDESTRINEQLTLDSLAGKAGPVDLVVWSEGSVSDIAVVNGTQFSPKTNSLSGYAHRAGTYTLFGGVATRGYDFGKIMNATVLMSPDGRIMDTYGKMHPVPFAENIPFFEYPSVRWFFKNVVGLWSTYTSGDRYTIFHVPLATGYEMTLGTPICFEDAFADLCRTFVLRGADLWINLTNDYWSDTDSSEIQHFQVARLRSVENRRVLVRSTNGGVTAVVGPKGEILASLPLFQRRTLSVDVPVYEQGGYTFYTRFGDYLPWFLGLSLLALLVGGLFRRREFELA